VSFQLQEELGRVEACGQAILPWILLDPVDSKMFGQLTIADCFFAMKD